MLRSKNEKTSSQCFEKDSNLSFFSSFWYTFLSEKVLLLQKLIFYPFKIKYFIFLINRPLLLGREKRVNNRFKNLISSLLFKGFYLNFADFFVFSSGCEKLS